MPPSVERKRRTVVYYVYILPFCGSIFYLFKFVKLKGEIPKFSIKEGVLLIKRRYLILLIILAVCLSSALFIINSSGYKSQLIQRGYHNLQRLKSAENDDFIRVYRADSEIIQIVSSEGYNGDIIILVSIKDDEITMVDILDHDETKDYGGYIVEGWFLNRLCLPIDDVLNTVKIKKVESNDVVAVTGATISSNAVVDGVNKCIKNYGGLRDE